MGAAYAAPELLRGVKYSSFSSDIWSLGCILFVMLCHRMPFRDDTVAMLMKDQKNPPRIPEHLDQKLSENAKTILKKMIQFYAETRITMEELVNDQWLDSTNSSTANHNRIIRISGLSTKSV